MDFRRLTAEVGARWAFGLVAIAFPAALLVAWRVAQTSQTTLRASLPETGGWQPATLYATTGEALRLRMISEDVVHGFAIGKSDDPSIELPPGEVVTASLVFEHPGTYTYYCTRWCGPDHWRMRGVIEVSGEGTPLAEAEPALYIGLGIDLDAPHEAAIVPARRPSAARGAALEIPLPEGNRLRDDIVARPPAEIWASLRADPATSGLTDSEVWDLVAFLWKSTTSGSALDQGRLLYADNCAACHGESGDGRGLLPTPTPHPDSSDPGGHTTTPADFTDPRHMLGASTALFQGKIVRGGMGTGMPYWGPILTEAQTWALADYLWTFQFEEGE